MKIFFISICCALYLGAQAQTVSTKTYPVTAGQQVDLKFDYPVVKVSTWDKNEVSITAHVSINNGESDSAFELSSQTENGVLSISDKIKDMDKLPKRYTVYKNGTKTVYTTKEEFEKGEKGGSMQHYSEGLDIDIVVEVKIPAHAVTNIKSVYGMVELSNLNSNITVDATYGGIDATITAANTGKLQATTSYGKIYSNLGLKITDHTERDFYNSITAEPGTGPIYKFTSTYGKIYLRKAL